MRVLCITLLLFLFPFSAADAQEDSTDTRRTKISLKSGFPTLSSGKTINFDFKNPEYGKIYSGDLFPGIYIVVNNTNPPEVLVSNGTE